MRLLITAFAIPLFLAAGCASNDTALLDQRIFELEKRVLALETREMSPVTEAEEITRIRAREELAELKLEREDMEKRYTNQHPEMIKVNQRIKDLLELIGE